MIPYYLLDYLPQTKCATMPATATTSPVEASIDKNATSTTSGIEAPQNAPQTSDPEIARLQTQLRMTKDLNATYQEQYRQEHDNTLMVIWALQKADPTAFEAIKGRLHGNTNEYDKLLADASRYREQYEAAQTELDSAKARNTELLKANDASAAGIVGLTEQYAELNAQLDAHIATIHAQAEETARLEKEIRQAKEAFKRTKLPESLRLNSPLDQLCQELVELYLNNQSALSDLRAEFVGAGYTGNLLSSVKVVLADLAEYKQRAAQATHTAQSASNK